MTIFSLVTSMAHICPTLSPEWAGGDWWPAWLSRQEDIAEGFFWLGEERGLARRKRHFEVASDEEKKQ